MSADVYKPQRQSHWAILFILWHTAWITIRQVWPLILILFVQPKERNEFSLYLIVGLIAVVGIISLINHFFFRFWIDSDTFYVREGWLKKKNKTIPIDRIQSLNVEQTLLHRFSKTGKVFVETAGSAKAEVEIRAIRMDVVEELQRKLFHTHRQSSGKVVETILSEAEKPLFTLGFLDLIKVGLSQNHLRTIGVVLAVAIGFLDDLENQWGILPEGKLEEMGEAVQSMMVLVMMGALLTVGVIIASVVRILLSHADLALFYNGQRFRLNAGLLTIRETVVSHRKLQSLTWSENPIQRLFGLVRLDFSQATVDSPEGRQQVAIPGMYRQPLQEILRLVFPSEKRDHGAWSGIDPRYAWKQWIGTGLLPALIIGIGGYIVEFTMWIPAMIWLLVSALFARKMTRRWQWFLNQDLLILKQGWLSPRTTMLPIYKIQSMSIHQNPIQRWRDLVSITVHTASGTEWIPYIPIDKARLLQRYVLYHIESDSRSWM